MSTGPARRAVAALFFANGAIFASWAGRIPAIQAAHGLNPGQLGLALLALAGGAVLAMPLAGVAAGRFGTARLCWIAGLVYAAALPLLAVAPSTAALVAGLFVFGAGHGVLDVAMNSQAVMVEQAHGTPIMASFHACFSIGGFAGSASAAALASAGWRPQAHFLLAGVTFGALIVAARSRLWPEAHAAVSKAHAVGVGSRWRIAGVLAALGGIAFCSMIGEGAMADWSALFLRHVRLTAESTAALGYALFSAAMTVGRLTGDRVTHRFGRRPVVAVGGTLAAAGLGAALLLPGALVTLAGFAVVGAGFSLIVPIVFTSAGETPGIAPALAVSLVTTLGYVGFLIGPPVIGLAAQASDLRHALGIVVATSIAIALLSRVMRPTGRAALLTARAPSRAPAHPLEREAA